MKKVLFMVAAMFMTLGASAQHEVGSFSLQPTVGMSIANITKADGAKARVGLVAGFEGQYQVSNLVGVSAGVLYSMEGAKGDDETQKDDYINIPILANFYVAKGLALKAGVQPAFLVSAKYGSTDVKDAFNKFDFSIPVGASYEYANFVLDARYNFGLTKIYKSSVGSDSKNSVFTITLGYRFDL